MLRNLNKSSGGRRILGTWHVGIQAATIAAETATGDNGPGLLYDESINPTNAGKQLRCRVTSYSGTPGKLFVFENGSLQIIGEADGAYTIGYAVDADGVQVSTDTAPVAVGPVSASAPAGTGTSTGSGTGGAAVGLSTGAGVAPGGIGQGVGSGTGGVATGGGSITAPGGTGTSIGSGQGGAAGNAILTVNPRFISRAPARNYTVRAAPRRTTRH